MSNEEPVKFEGRLFPSQKAAARFFGVQPRTIRRWLDAGRDAKVTGPNAPVMLGGRLYRNIDIAAKAAGTSAAVVRQAYKRAKLTNSRGILTTRGMLYLEVE